MRISLKSKLCW